MKNIKYALLLDELKVDEQSKSILEHISTKPNMDIRIFLLDKEQMMPNPFPVFNIADYFNFGEGVTLITSEATKSKAENYPVKGLSIIIGDNIPGYINVGELDLNKIEKVVNEYYAKH